MIQPQELRIGNLIYIDQLSEAKEVYAFGIATISVTKPKNNDEIEGYYFTQVRGIPLSEEWLCRLGFELDEEDTTFFHHRTGFPLTKQFSMYAGSYIEWVKIDYVHQLQNTHFILTGAELTLKP